MKKIILGIMAALCAMGASAQRASDTGEFTLWDNERVEQRVIIGPRVGLNVSSMSGEERGSKVDFKNKIGFRAGLAVEFPIVSSFYINSGLFYSVKGFKLDDNDYNYREKLTASAGYIELPVYLSYRLNFAEHSQLQLNFGPYFAYGINGKCHYEEWYKGDKGDDFKCDFFGNDDEDDGLCAKRFDAGLGVGLGYTFNKIYAGFDCQWGLSNVVSGWDEDNTSYKHININFSVGFNF